MTVRSMSFQPRAFEFEDEEMLMMSDEDLLVPDDHRRQKNARVRIVPAMLGTAALMACAFVLTTHVWSNNGATSKPAKRSAISARALLESDDLVEAVTDNVMAQGVGYLSSQDRASVRALAAQKFYNVSSQFRVFDPAGSTVLDQVLFDDSQRNASLRLLRSLSDPRVQSMSLLVARTIRDSPSENPAVLERRLSEAFA